MTRAAIVYRSRTGTTRRYADAIGAHLRTRGVDASVVSVGEFDMAALADVDLLLLGCWTDGLFVVLQHPDGPWLEFARALPALARPRVALFTTYRLATGSMFARMRTALAARALAGRPEAVEIELKSRDGTLSEQDRSALDRFVAGR